MRKNAPVIRVRECAEDAADRPFGGYATNAQWAPHHENDENDSFDPDSAIETISA
jgi:hypothetical protein